jgi:hypothetical protein
MKYNLIVHSLMYGAVVKVWHNIPKITNPKKIL